MLRQRRPEMDGYRGPSCPCGGHCHVFSRGARLARADWVMPRAHVLTMTSSAQAKQAGQRAYGPTALPTAAAPCQANGTETALAGGGAGAASSTCAKD